MNQIWPYPSAPMHSARDDLRIPRRPWGWGGRPYGFGYGFGFPLLGGFLGGLTAGALLRPPFYSPYPYYGGYWY